MNILPPRIRSLHSFVWLHALNSDDLNDLTIDSYKESTGFETPEHNLKGLWEWEESVFQECFSHCKRVIVAGAGGGREMIALSRMGMEVVGFDPSNDLVEACRRNLRLAKVPAVCFFAPPGEIPGESKSFDGLVIGRGVYHHIPGSARRVAFLKACARRVFNGSPVAIGDFLTRTSKRSLTSYALGSAIEQGDAISTSFYHYFTQEEIRSELDQAGYDLEEYRVTPFPGGAKLAHVIARTRT